MKSTKKILIFTLLLTLIFGNFLFFSKIAKAEDKPDLSFTNEIESSPLNINKGDTVTFGADIKNTGNAVADSVWVKWYLNDVEYSSCSTNFGIFEINKELGVGCTVNNIDYTENIKVEMKIDPNNLIDESDETNNILIKTFKSDLTIKNVYFSPQNPKVGEPFSGHLRVEFANLGESGVVGSYPVNLVLSSNWILLDWADVDQTIFADNIITGATHTLSFDVKKDYIFQSNPLEIRAWIDSNAIGLNENLGNDNLFIDESNENNNTFYKKITLAEDKPDLIIQDIFFEDDLVKIKYCNDDSGISNEYFYIKMTANGKTHTGTSNNSNYLFEVPAPATCKNTDGYPISYFGLTDEYTFEAKAEIDWENKIDESNENNNSFTKFVYPTSESLKSDFVITDITKSESNELWVYFKNLGNSTFGRLTVEVVDLDTNDSYTKNNEQFYHNNASYKFYLGEIKAKSQNSYRLQATVDSKNLFKESKEDNNDLIKTLEFAQEPTLTCTDSDGGKNYSKKGTATGIAYWAKSLPASDIGDACTSSIKLNELFCDSDGYVRQESYDCPYGCANDACIPKPQPQPKPTTTKSPPIAQRLSGKLLLDVDQGGAIWYVDHINYKRHNVKWNNALNIFQNFALGITDNDLLKIPAKTESINPDLDTDGDGYKDEHELKNGYSPYNNKLVKFKIDNKVGQRLKGRFLLQVQKQGAIWYVDSNGYRHNVRWNNLRPLFESLALGITNFDLKKISEE